MKGKAEMRMSTRVERMITQAAHKLNMTQTEIRHLSLSLFACAYHRLTDDEAHVLLATLEERL
jgi:hypothetical protein